MLDVKLNILGVTTTGYKLIYDLKERLNLENIRYHSTQEPFVFPVLFERCVYTIKIPQ
jgi:hypothetical protein